MVIIGNITADKLNCLNSVVCHGDMNIKSIYVGEDIIANSIKCDDFTCDGNAIIKTTIDISESSKTEKTMIACEGIMGDGDFKALNAIANEYFEFNGTINGNIVELETDTTFSKLTIPETPINNNTDNDTSDPIELTFDNSLTITQNLLDGEINKISDWSEEHISEFLTTLSETNISILANQKELFENLISISYRDEITDFGEYLIALYAQKVLPKEFIDYETIEHIFSQFLPDAKDNLDEMEFFPESINKLATALKLIGLCDDVLDIPVSEAYDKVFNSIGLKFTTVENATKSELLAELDQYAGTGDNAAAHRILVKHGYKDSKSEEYQKKLALVIFGGVDAAYES